jgi:hypothetical protein
VTAAEHLARLQAIAAGLELRRPASPWLSILCGALFLVATFRHPWSLWFDGPAGLVVVACSLRLAGAYSRDRARFLLVQRDALAAVDAIRDENERRERAAPTLRPAGVLAGGRGGNGSDFPSLSKLNAGNVPIEMPHSSVFPAGEASEPPPRLETPPPRARTCERCGKPWNGIAAVMDPSAGPLCTICGQPMLAPLVDEPPGGHAESFEIKRSSLGPLPAGPQRDRIRRYYYGQPAAHLRATPEAQGVMFDVYGDPPPWHCHGYECRAPQACNCQCGGCAHAKRTYAMPDEPPPESFTAKDLRIALLRFLECTHAHMGKPDDLTACTACGALYVAPHWHTPTLAFALRDAWSHHRGASSGVAASTANEPPPKPCAECGHAASDHVANATHNGCVHAYCRCPLTQAPGANEPPPVGQRGTMRKDENGDVYLSFAPHAEPPPHVCPQTDCKGCGWPQEPPPEADPWKLGPDAPPPGPPEVEIVQGALCRVCRVFIGFDEPWFGEADRRARLSEFWEKHKACVGPPAGGPSNAACVSILVAAWEDLADRPDLFDDPARELVPPTPKDSA